MSIAGPVSDSFWRQQQTTLSEMLLRAGNQRAARLLSLVPAAALGEADVWDPVQVVLLARPSFLDLFRPAELQAIAEQMNQVRSWDASTGHQVTVAPLLADPFARATLGSSAPGPVAQQATDFRADQQLVPRIQEAVPPSPRVTPPRQVKQQARTERNNPEIAQPTSVSRVPKLLEARPAGPRLLSHRGRYRPHPAIIDVDKRHEQLVSVEFAERRQIKVQTAALRLIHQVGRVDWLMLGEGPRQRSDGHGGRRR
jgi:hypothetical protein